MLRKTKTALLVALIVGAVGSSAAAQDQEAGDIRVDLPARKAEPRDEPVIRTRKDVGEVGPLRIYGGINVQVGGSATFHFSRLGIDAEGSVDLDPTIGLQAGADYVVHKYFSIGGETRLNWIKVDGAADRTLLWDLDVKPRGRYAFHNLPLELYGAMPLGLTVAGDITSPGEGEVNGKAGFNIGLLAGANWFFTKNMGINAEIGWQFHRFGLEALGEDLGHVTTNQFVLLCPNFIYAL